MTTEFSGGRSAQLQPTITFVEDSPTRNPRIDLNTVDAADLTRLPGIGRAVARRIVDARKRRAFTHVDDLVTTGLVSKRVFARIRKMVAVGISEDPYLYQISTTPEHAIYEKPFKLNIAFNDSVSGARLVRVQADSVSHSIDVTREVTEAERGEGLLSFDMPGMAAGVMNVQVSLYDSAGHKDYIARTLHIFHNPPFAVFYPSERSLRLSNGAAQMKSDGRFHCNSNFYFYNGTSSTVSINPNMTWRILNQSGSLLESGNFNFGSTITLGPWAISSGWWFNINFPPGNVTFNRLQAKEWIRIEYRFTEVGTGAAVGDDLTWRAVLGPHINLIRVGEENFTNAERTRIFNALRNSAGTIYQQQDMDIGTIRTYVISVADAGGYVVINSNDEAEDLTGDWTVPNDALDMFVVRSYVGSVAGLSPVGGPCDKDAKGMNGNVIELQSSQAILGIIMAHELGHYLGLSHTNEANNLMRPTASTSNTVITNSQGNTMKGHCFIRFLD
jgi:hypothetical protein